MCFYYKPLMLVPWLAKKKKTCRENVGLLGSTRIGSRRVIQISAGFMIFFSMLGEQNMSLLRLRAREEAGS